jgi:hypothetical protein
MTREQMERCEAWAACAERDGDPEAGEAIRALRRRCEELERERDEALAECERAEADNAALLEALNSVAWRPTETNAEQDAHDAAVKAASAPHPGAALLAEVEALRGLRKAVEPWRVVLSQFHPDDNDADDHTLLDACAAVDALKERKT